MNLKLKFNCWHLFYHGQLHPSNFCLKVLIKILPNTRLPRWHGGWESACQCRGHSFDPWSGKIPNTPEQLKPTHHNYWTQALESSSRNYWAHALQQGKPHNAAKSSPSSLQLEKAHTQQHNPSAAKNKQELFKNITKYNSFNLLLPQTGYVFFHLQAPSIEKLLSML